MKRFLFTYLAPVLIINFGNACAYAFQIVLARALTPADVGAFNALLSSVTLLAAPASIAPVAITRMTLMQHKAAGDAGIPAVVARTTIFALLAALVVGVATLMAGPWLQSLLKIRDTQTIVLFAGLFAVTLVFPVPAGWFQGLGRNVAMSVIQGGMPILRFVFGFCLLWVFAGGLDAAVIASALPCIVVFLGGLIVLWPGRAAFSQPLVPGLARDTLAFVLPAATSATLIYALFNIDMVLVRALMPVDESGLYAMAAVVGRIPFLLPAALAGIFYADLARRQGDGPDRQRRLILLNLAVVGGIAFALAIGLALVAEPLLVLMAGPHYASAAPLMRMSCVAMAGLSLLNLAVTLAMARDDHRPLLALLAGVLGFVLASVFLATSAQHIALYLTVAIYAMLGVCLVILLGGRTEKSVTAGEAMP